MINENTSEDTTNEQIGSEHKSQWLRLESENKALSKTEGDIYDYRAKSCTNLLKLYCC